MPNENAFFFGRLPAGGDAARAHIVAVYETFRRIDALRGGQCVNG